MFGRLTEKNIYTPLDEMALLMFLESWWYKHAGRHNNDMYRGNLCCDTFKFVERNVPEQKKDSVMVEVNCGKQLNPPAIINNGMMHIRISYITKGTKETTQYDFLLPRDIYKLRKPLWKLKKLQEIC